MSDRSEPNRGSQTYGFPSRGGQDRHIQNIIDHTSSLFPGSGYQLPRIDPSASHYGSGGSMNRFDNEQDEQGLDDFVQNIVITAFPCPLPILLINSDVWWEMLAIISQLLRLEILILVRHTLEIHPTLGDSNRVRCLNLFLVVMALAEYGSSNLECKSSNTTSSVDNLPTSSSPMNIGASSPTTRLSLKQKAKPADSPLVTPRWASRSKLDLDHAPDGPPVVNNTHLVDPRQVLPDKFRSVFPYELFNVVQSKCFPLVYGTSDNVVVSAPTGSGKTAILEMAICQLAMSPGGENFKIVYQAPTKSLCSERAQDWEKKFSHMNLRCVELTGDTSQAQASRVGNASIIVTTPEKWDSITRKWSDHRKLLEMIRLVLIDEVHILKDTRGATLEAVVSRMKTIGANVRFVALSATVPNIGDIARWLGRDHSRQQEPAKFEAFGEELRPVKLRRYVYGYGGLPNDFVFEKSLDGKLALLLAKHSERKPIMVFCFTRKSCESTARKLAEWWSTCRAEDRAWPAPARRVPVVDGELQEIVRYGVAFHHAGLEAQDRSAVAQNFINGQLHVICCTSTLAVGVNLPCHTVVLKGTTGYCEDKLQEYSDLEVIQMLGRAGRPQFDDSAVAIIMTKAGNVDRYKRMISGEEALESTLHRNLVEHLNSEISLGTIQDVQTAKRWIGGTFLSVRVRQSPALYNLTDVRNAEEVDKMMEEWCERDVKLLQQYELVTKEAPFKCSEYGHAMSRYMVNFETMKLLLSIPRGAKLEEILTTICKAIEFKDFRFKHDERALFRELGKSPFILHPIKETLTQTWHKIFLMVQIHLGGVEVPTGKEFSSFRYRIATHKNAIFDRLNRLVRCLIDCKAFDGDGVSTNASLELLRAVTANSWENKPSQLSQIPGSGPVTVRKWVSHGIHTVLGLADREFDEIERISSRNPPYGKNLLKTLEKFPRLTLRTHLATTTAYRPQLRENVMVILNVNLGYCNTKGMPSWNNRVPAVTFVVFTTDGNLAYFWRGNLKKIDGSAGLDLKFPVALSGPDQVISCHFSCEEIVGTQVTKTVKPDVPTAVFRNSSVHLGRRQTQTANLPDDDMDYSDIPDEDLLSAARDSANCDDEAGSLNYPGLLDNTERDFPLADDLLREMDSLAPGPLKMDNGKWMCNHHCRNGGLTASGKPCNHRCCHEGLDKPRPPPRGKGKNKDTGGSEKVEESFMVEPLTKCLQASQASTDFGGGKSEGPARPESTVNSEDYDPGVRQKPSRLPSETDKTQQTRPNTKRKRSSGDDDNGERLTKRRNKVKDHGSDLDATSDIECIDLSGLLGDNETPPSSLKGLTSGGRRKGKLIHVHENVRENVTNLAANTKSFDVKASPVSPKVRRDNGSGPLDEAGPIPDQGDPLSHYGSDVFEDDDEFPDLESLMQLNKLDDVSASKKSELDETLYPGVVRTLKESIDHGQDPDLSFTTVDELQKASERFDLPPVNLSARDALPESSSTAPEMATQEPTSSLLGSRKKASASSPEMEDLQPPFPCSELQESDPSEPAWLSEFDSEFINSLRGCVNFVD
ncbi:ATP-dependent DNA helicase MER3 [Parahypoxylon ruwenzoriense]